MKQEILLSFLTVRYTTIRNLREELIEKGHVFSNNADTEVLDSRI